MDGNGFKTRFFNKLSKIHDSMDDHEPDVTLFSVEDATDVKCHRLVLSASSEYFSNTFQWNGARCDRVEVHNGISGSTLKVIVKFMYSGQMELTTENANEILSAANYFQIPEAIDACILYLMNLITVDCCLDLLLLAWQLDIGALLKPVTQFCCHHFYVCVERPPMREKVYNLPLELVKLLLSSNDLVLRDSVTKLFTSPGEREKAVLKFALEFLESRVEFKESDLSLLSCVKWAILDQFSDKQKMVDTVVGVTDNPMFKQKVLSLFNVTHSKWFSEGGSEDLATDRDKEMYSCRAYSCSELLTTIALADNNRVSSDGTLRSAPPDLFEFSCEYITELSVATRLWDGDVIIGGIEMAGVSSDGGPTSYQIGTHATDANSLHVIKLNTGEHIVHAEGRSGWLVDQLSFKSSDGNDFGPFGGNDGKKRDLMAAFDIHWSEEATTGNVDFVDAPKVQRLPLGCYLVGVKGEKVVTDGDAALKRLSFIFRSMISRNNFLLQKDKPTEVKREDDNDDVDNRDDIEDYDYYDTEEYQDYLDRLTEEGGYEYDESDYE